jgi:phospholipase/lecithinase/hemolysin
MTTAIQRLVIFGDSFSDIGVKRNTALGAFAAFLGKMRTNQVNRFSDNRNWTDFLWEWSGGSPLITVDRATSIAATSPHLTWSANSANGSTSKPPVFFANYAEGGAMGGSDISGVGLGTFAQQFDRYKADLAKHGPAPGVGLYLIWFGLNDLVTNKRDWKKMQPVAKEIARICGRIAALDKNAAFLVGNLPDPQTAVRYMGQEDTSEVIGYTTGALEFGNELANALKTELPGNIPAALVDVFTPMYHVSKNLNSYGFTQAKQPTGIEVRYGAAPKNQAAASYTTTSDGAHPTEEVYKVIAQIWAEEIKKHFELAALRQNADARFVVKGSN